MNLISLRGGEEADFMIILCIPLRILTAKLGRISRVIICCSVDNLAVISPVISVTLNVVVIKGCEDHVIVLSSVGISLPVVQLDSQIHRVVQMVVMRILEIFFEI